MADTWPSLIDTDILGPCMSVFGSTATYTFKAGGSQIIIAVFDEQFLSLSPLGAGPFGSTEGMSLGAPGALTSAKPVLGVQLSQFLRPPAQGDMLSVPNATGNALNFKVKEVQADGHGAAKLTLTKISVP